MRKLTRGEIETRAPGVGFEKVHPTETGGKSPFKRGPNLPEFGPSDGDESKFVKCVHCGWPVNTDEAPDGSGWGNMDASISYPASTTLDDYSLGGYTSVGVTLTTTHAAGTVGGRTITPTADGVCRWIVGYIEPSAATDMVALLYHQSSGKLLSESRERNIGASAQWAAFPLLHAVDIKTNEPVVATIQGESAYDFYRRKFASGDGKYVTGTYDYYPARVSLTSWSAVDAQYLAYLSSYSDGGYYEVPDSHGGCPHCGSSNYRGDK